MESTVHISSSDTASSDFVELPYRLYKDDPAWRPPLRLERRAQVSARKNPAMARIAPRFFTAVRDGKTVGRIAAFTNSAHDARYGSADAFFGYFDCEPDRDAEDALLETAKTWAREQGRSRLVGPSMWSVNEECGLLVDGFEHPPAVMMPYGRPSAVAAVERHGFSKIVDLQAYLADLRDGAPNGPVVRKLCASAERDPGITWRPMDTSDFKAEVALAMDIFNDAWSDNWGFLPFSQAQIDHMASEMRPIMFREGFQVAYIDGEAAAFVWMIPDINEAVRDFGGSLLPLNWVKLLWRIKRGHVTKARIPLMGLRKVHQKTRRGVAAVCRINAAVFDAGHARGFEQSELSWILEDNEGVKRICGLADAELYKTYRMYAAEL